MKRFQKNTDFKTTSDASLVASSLRGDQQAYGEIVVRYQRLLCSLAYASLGNLAASEDVAQEAFIEAWKKLANLQEPEKLKAWLCGILRFKVSHYRRKEARQPIRDAEELQEAAHQESSEKTTEEITMREEEQGLLWDVLERVPVTYREPLVLYYREHRSIEHVACELGLSEDAVKQRLSRGRKLLQERMMRFVEDALAKSAPSTVFTMGVLAAVATIVPPAKAATAGATAAKVGSGFKGVTLAAFMASVSGLISMGFGLRASLDQSRTKRERREVVMTVAGFFSIAAVFVAGMFGLKYFALDSYERWGYFSIAAQVGVIAFTVSYMILTYRMLKRMRILRASERLRRPDLFDAPVDQPGSKKREYRSRWTLLGVPLFHFKFGMAEEGEKPAMGWISGGASAYGLLFAWGGFAVAPVSVGIVSVGFVSVGAVGIGVVGIGTVGIGLLAMGAAAIGYKAFASLSAMGWESAWSGGFSIAKEAAIGPIPLAKQVNNETAAEIANLAAVNQNAVWILGALTVLVIVPVVLYANAVRKRMQR